VIRDFRPEDATAAAALYPEYEWMTEAKLLHALASRPPRAQPKAWVRDDLSGFVFAELAWASREPGLGYIVSKPTADDLYDVAEAHLAACGAARIRSLGDGLERRGYESEHVEVFSALEPTRVEVLPGPRPLGDFEDRRREVYELSRACADLPGGEPEDEISFEEWLLEALGDPALDHDGSFVLEVDCRPVAYALLIVDRERGIAANEMTGTHRDLRGRGLATAVKLATIDWAAQNGISCIYTSNHEGNAPMLAVNRKLGYRMVAEVVDYERTAGLPSSHSTRRTQP
jgi:RimJ/RimL family protein N-acetyltransferase